VKRNRRVFIFIILGFNICFAQHINIKVNNFVGEKATLSILSGEKISFIDTTTSMNESEFHFSLDNNHSGTYRFSLTNNKWIDFIYDNEDVELETEANNLLDSLKIIKSEPNKIYYYFVKLNQNYKTKSELLQLILARYPIICS